MGATSFFKGKLAKLIPADGIEHASGVRQLSGTLDPTLVAVDAPAGSTYQSSSTGFLYQKLDAGSTTNWTTLSRDVVETKIVAPAGAPFTSIQAAINSITDASAVKPYMVLVRVGIYTENIVTKNYVYLRGEAGGATQITGTLTGTLTGAAGVEGIRINFAPTADGQSAVNISGGILYFKNNSIVLSGAGNWAVTGALFSSGTGYTLSDSTVSNNMTFAGITKNFVGWELGGAGAYGINSINVSDRVAAASGTRCLFKVTGTGTYSQLNGTAIHTNTLGAFAGTVNGFCVSTASAALSRLTSAISIRLTGVSGGTAVGFELNSGGASAEFQHVNSTVFINGFNVNQEYSVSTNVTDTQKVWFNAINKNLPKAGTGLSIITPYDQNTSGFVDWGTGTTYWTYVAGTKTFTVDRRGTGVVRSAPVTWTAGQSVVLTDLAVNYVYMNSAGVIGVTTSISGGLLYVDNIVLFEVWVQGTNFLVSKENHPWEFTSAVSRSWHNLFGPLLESASQTLTIAVAANRTVNLGGTNTLNDHGVTSSISPQSPATWFQTVTGTSGKMYQIGDAVGLISRKSDPANTTGTVVAVNRRIIFRLGVIKDSLNSANPIFVSYADTTDYGTNAAANNAIAAGTVAAFPSELRELEICQLGYAVVQANGAGAGTLVTVTPAFQVFGAQFVAGGTSTAGSLITLNAANFNGQLSGAETNVQVAFERIDDYGYLPQYAAGREYRVGNQLQQNNAVYVCTIAVLASTTWSADKGSFEQISVAHFADVTAAQAASASESDLCYVASTLTFYQYFANPGAYTVDGTYVLSTADAGTSRWLAVAGQYSITYTLDTRVYNSTNNGIITTSGESTLNAVTTRLSAFSSLSEWTTGLVYRVGNTTRNNGVLYRANTLHTASATFATDAAKWDAVGIAGTKATLALLPSQVNTILAPLASWNDGTISGWVETSTPLREHFTFNFTKNGAGTYVVSNMTVGGDVTGVTFDVDGSGNLTYSSGVVLPGASFTYAIDVVSSAIVVPATESVQGIINGPGVRALVPGGTITSVTTSTIKSTDGATAITTAAGGAVTVGPATTSAVVQKINTGSPAVNALSANISAGQIGFGTNTNNETSPCVFGRTDTVDTNGLVLRAYTNNTNAAADMQFQVSENDDTDFATTTSPAYGFYRHTTALGSVTRAGAWMWGATSLASYHTINGTVVSNCLASANQAYISGKNYCNLMCNVSGDAGANTERALVTQTGYAGLAIASSGTFNFRVNQTNAQTAGSTLVTTNEISIGSATAAGAWTFPVSISTQKIFGRTNGSTPSTGEIGESIAATGTNGSFTNNNNFDALSITLGVGVWEVSGNLYVNPTANAGETVSVFTGSISTVSATGSRSYGYDGFYVAAGVNPYNVFTPVLKFPSHRLVVTSGTQNVYLVASVTASAYTTMGVTGWLEARRIA